MPFLTSIEKCDVPTFIKCLKEYKSKKGKVKYSDIGKFLIDLIYEESTKAASVLIDFLVKVQEKNEYNMVNITCYIFNILREFEFVINDIDFYFLVKKYEKKNPVYSRIFEAIVMSGYDGFEGKEDEEVFNFIKKNCDKTLPKCLEEHISSEFAREFIKKFYF